MNNDIYLCADSNDLVHEQRLRDGLKPILARLGLTLWGRRDTQPGTEWKKVTRQHLDQADFFVALVSASCLNDDLCRSEFQIASARARQGKLGIASILLSSVPFFEFTELAPFPVLPKDGKPISSHGAKTDQTWTDVLRDLVEMIGATHRYIA